MNDFQAQRFKHASVWSRILENDQNIRLQRFPEQMPAHNCQHILAKYYLEHLADYNYYTYHPISENAHVEVDSTCATNANHIPIQGCPYMDT